MIAVEKILLKHILIALNFESTNEPYNLQSLTTYTGVIRIKFGFSQLKNQSEDLAAKSQSYLND